MLKDKQGWTFEQLMLLHELEQESNMEALFEDFMKNIPCPRRKNEPRLIYISSNVDSKGIFFETWMKIIAKNIE